MDKIHAFIATGKGEKIGHYAEIIEKTGIENKALIPLNGKPMIYYVLEALDAAESVESITIAGLTKDDISLEMKKPLYFIEGGNSSFETLNGGMRHFREIDNPPSHVLNVTCDIPLITAEMVDMVVRAADLSYNKDIFFNVGIFENFRQHFPERKKTKVRLDQGFVVGGDLNIFSPEVFVGKSGDTLKEMFANRKSVIHMVKSLSFRFIFKFLLKRLSIADIVRLVEKKFGLTAVAVITSFVAQSVDVDYYEDFPKMEEWLKQERYKVTDKDTITITDGTNLYN
ncbi:MAG: NTP transferase domain-containing protein [Candidatus Heimdallarchaeota archaeon]|nr:NTP transferase domain-containing protein [Candidatus Heimdallarchaeota archaeon]